MTTPYSLLTQDVEVEGAIPTLAPALLSRFESEKGYRPFPETLSSCESSLELGAAVLLY